MEVVFQYRHPAGRGGEDAHGGGELGGEEEWRFEDPDGGGKGQFADGGHERVGREAGYDVLPVISMVCSAAVSIYISCAALDARTRESRRTPSQSSHLPFRSLRTAAPEITLSYVPSILAGAVSAGAV